MAPNRHIYYIKKRDDGTWSGDYILKSSFAVVGFTQTSDVSSLAAVYMWSILSLVRTHSLLEVNV